MDEKYLELRNRLESSRKLFSTQMSRVHKESSELRVKYSMATHGKLLDALPMPNQNTFSFTGESEGFRTSGDQSDPRMSTAGKKGKPRAASAHASSASRSSPAMTSHNGSSPHGHQRGQSFNFAGQAAESWNPKSDLPYDLAPFKDKASKLFTQGMTHNHQYNHTPVPHYADPEQKEKQVLRKIADKQKKSGLTGWTDERLQELVKS